MFNPLTHSLFIKCSQITKQQSSHEETCRPGSENNQEYQLTSFNIDLAGRWRAQFRVLQISMIDAWVRLRARGTRWLQRRHRLSTVHMLDITARSTYTVLIGRANDHRTWSSTVVTVNWRCIIFICSLCHRWTAAGLGVNRFLLHSHFLMNSNNSS